MTLSFTQAKENTMTELKNILNSHYQQSEAQLNGLRDSKFHQKRKEAYEAFSVQEFPTQRVEEWKHLNLKSVVSTAFRTDSASSLQREDLPEFIDLHEHNVLMFRNGCFMPDWSQQVDANFTMLSLHQAYAEHRDLVDKHLTSYIPAHRNAFVAANSACMEDGAFVWVKASQQVAHELVILNVIDSREAAQLVQPRNLIVVEKNAELRVIMRSVTVGAHPSLCNQVSECVLDENAELHCVFVQDDSALASIVNTFQVEQQATSRARLTTASLSGSIIRNDVGTRLAQSGAEAHMYGLYCLSGSTVVDNHTVMDHATPHCHSNELYKGILDERAQGIFNGKIYVRKDAQKTLAYQSNRNVLLSKTASVNTKPQLEILADDVKCSHGCTVGTLDGEALFYLRARAIGEAQAKALLLIAFAEDVTMKIDNSALREFIDAKIERQLLEQRA